ncbi:hypothetical protein AA313_de0209087 [Arthrobotrys entomopaga]|nr:hypothetical protein AA313_de0209087 [Arthrobotrys entomopaga]
MSPCDSGPLLQVSSVVSSWAWQITPTHTFSLTNSDIRASLMSRCLRCVSVYLWQYIIPCRCSSIYGSGNGSRWNKLRVPPVAGGCRGICFFLGGRGCGRHCAVRTGIVQSGHHAWSNTSTS